MFKTGCWLSCCNHVWSKLRIYIIWFLVFIVIMCSWCQWVCLAVDCRSKVCLFRQWAAAKCDVLLTANTCSKPLHILIPLLFWFPRKQPYLNSWAFNLYIIVVVCHRIHTIHKWNKAVFVYYLFYCFCRQRNGRRQCCTSCRSCLVQRRWLPWITVRETGALNRTAVVDQCPSVHQVLWCMLPPLYDYLLTGCFNSGENLEYLMQLW